MVVKDRPILDTNEIVRRYLVGESVKNIARYFRVRDKVIADILHLQNVRITGSKRYFDIQDDFFKIIDSEAKAYWLGFLYADGYISKLGSYLELSLAVKDEEHLRKFRELVGKSLSIKHRTTFSKKYRKRYKSCRLHICSSKFVSHLITAGCINNKSLVLDYPTGLSEDLHRHFIRGYIDGDGSIIFSKKDKVVIDVLGTENMLNAIQRIFHMKISGYKNVKISRTGKIFQLRKSGIHCANAVLKFLYTDATIYLTRKYNRFTTLCRAK